MKITKLYPQGYCKGVYNAIKIAIETRKKYPDENIYILGLIIHNKLIKNELEKFNIISLYSKTKSRLELINDVDKGIIILTAHGTDVELINKIKERKLILVDTTCTFVKSTYKLIEDELKDNHEVIYIGIHGHPEATATVSINREKIYLIQNENEVEMLNLKDNSPLITNQTTVSIDQIRNISNKIKEKYPLSRLSNEQCSATRMRQNTIINLSNEYDLILIVGDSLSNNSKQLYKLAKEKTDACLIESIEDLDIEILKNKHNIAITSGASTPSAIVEQIFKYIQNFDSNDIKTHIKPSISEINILKEFIK